tara:strand:+ start:678 stop:941 length:264 start_codon:yes stop_codon:yes gene_type:complete
VTIKPPTTFIVAKITATRPKYEPISPPDVVEIIAPTIAIPDIALDPLIRGVCRVGGTLVMISIPTKMASIKTVIILISIYYPSYLSS